MAHCQNYSDGGKSTEDAHLPCRFSILDRRIRRTGTAKGVGENQGGGISLQSGTAKTGPTEGWPKKATLQMTMFFIKITTTKKGKGGGNRERRPTWQLKSPGPATCVRGNHR